MKLRENEKETELLCSFPPTCDILVVSPIGQTQLKTIHQRSSIDVTPKGKTPGGQSKVEKKDNRSGWGRVTKEESLAHPCYPHMYNIPVVMYYYSY